MADIEIKYCYALTEYVGSGSIQTFFDRIHNETIIYEYEDTEVVIKSLPSDDTSIRIDNIRGGNTPRYLLAGFDEWVPFDDQANKSMLCTFTIQFKRTLYIFIQACRT